MFMPSAASNLRSAFCTLILNGIIPVQPVITAAIITSAMYGVRFTKQRFMVIPPNFDYIGGLAGFSGILFEVISSL